MQEIDEQPFFSRERGRVIFFSSFPPLHSRIHDEYMNTHTHARHLREYMERPPRGLEDFLSLLLFRLDNNGGVHAPYIILIERVGAHCVDGDLGKKSAHMETAGGWE